MRSDSREAPSPRLSLVLEPVSGRAIPLYRGEALRITLIEGSQCVDFNCFNLANYKEHMSQARTRLLNPEPGVGTVIVSRPPHFRPMLRVDEMSDSCVIDMIGPGCHARLWQRRYGFDSHPNCQDTLAESIAEYGLTAEDVHDSFNMWYSTTVDKDGRHNPYGVRLKANKGDYIQLRAHMDVLAVPVICGGADLQAAAGNFWPKPILVEVFGEPLHERESEGAFLQRVEGYKHQFVDYPLEISSVSVPLTNEERSRLISQWEPETVEDDEDLIRSTFMDWYNRHRARLDPWTGADLIQ